MFSQLSPKRIVETTDRLARRIEERFPDSGLAGVADEVLALAKDSNARVMTLSQPNWWLRGIAGTVIVAIVFLGAMGLVALPELDGARTLPELLQALEAGVQDILFIGLFCFFMMSLEGRIKRREALRQLHELRSLAHVIDMHQLTKDPERLISPLPETSSSPERISSPFELGRYLDYCSELLSIVGKLAALYAQALPDSEVYSAVNDIETLVNGLSRKVWQKIGILDRIVANSSAESKAPASPPRKRHPSTAARAPGP